MYNRSLTFFTVAIFAAVAGFGQSSPSATVESAKDNTFKAYANTIGGRTFLYNGPVYKAGAVRHDEHPFMYDDWVSGTVNYRGYLFSDVPLLYDVTMDALVTENYYSKLETVLINEQVGEFTLGNRTFRNYETGTSLPHSGYYEVLYDGPTQIVVRHEKISESRIEFKTVIIEYRKVVRYFIYKNGRFFQIRNRSGILNVLADRKKELRMHIRKNHLGGSGNQRSLFRAVAAHYDMLTLRND